MSVTGGSLNLRAYRIARRDGSSVEDACALSGIPPAEAALIERDDERDPPGPECFEPLKPEKNIPENIPEPEPDGLPAYRKEADMPKHDLPDEADDTPEDFNPLIELAAETLRGDIRDSLLDWFKAQPKSWPFMSETEQRNLADAADRYSRELIKQACKIIAAGERPTIVAKLVEYKEKDGVEAKLKLPSQGEVVAALHEACGREVLLVTSGAEDFMDEGGGPEIDADQPKFPNLGEEYDEAA